MPRGADGGQPHLQHFASHGPDHVLQTLQHSHSTPVVQQVGGDRDDLKERERLPGRELSPQSSSLQSAQPPLNPPTLDKHHQHSRDSEDAPHSSSSALHLGPRFPYTKECTKCTEQ